MEHIIAWLDTDTLLLISPSSSRSRGALSRPHSSAMGVVPIVRGPEVIPQTCVRTGVRVKACRPLEDVPAVGLVGQQACSDERLYRDWHLSSSVRAAVEVDVHPRFGSGRLLEARAVCYGLAVHRDFM